MKKAIYFFSLFLLFFPFGCSSSVIEDSQITDEEKITEENNMDEGSEANSSKHPNILLIIADDMSLDATPNYANDLNAKKPVMPTLEKLMNNGLVFDNLWSYSLCSPTRASILTGKHGVHTGVKTPIKGLLSGNHKSLQTFIDEGTNNAYVHAVFGKWHLGNNVIHPTQTMGIQTYAGNLGGGVPDYWEYNLVQNEIETQLISNTEAEKKENYSTTKYTQLAIDWKEQQTKPWFVWLAYNAAHTPFHRPDNSLISEQSKSSSETNLNNYLAMLEAMDYEMGRLIDSMSDAEKANTVIIFIGDNGTPKRVAQFANTDKHRKGSIYQGGINVPMVVSGLNVRIGRESNLLIHTVDLFATIAEIAGVNVKSIHNSFSFKEALQKTSFIGKEFLYTEVPGSNSNGYYTVRNSMYKLIYEIDTGTKELYNLIDDKYEETDIMLRTLTQVESENLALLEAEGRRIREE